MNPTRTTLLLSASCLATLIGACGGMQEAAPPSDRAAFCADPVGAPAVPRSGHLPTHQGAFVVHSATVMTGAGQTWAPGWVHVQDGQIVAAGEGQPPNFPQDVAQIDGTGQWLTPGIIDTHSHLGVYPSPGGPAHSDGNEATSPFTPEVQALHSVWPQDVGFQTAAAGGVTTLHVLPGSANLVGGQGVTLQNRRGALVAGELVFPGAPLSLKMACGENPKRVYGERGGPATRMGEVARLRQRWLEVQEYGRRWDDHGRKVEAWCEGEGTGDRPPDPPGRNLGHEAMRGVLTGDIHVQFHCYRADEMLVHLQVAEEFGYEIRSFHHGVEAYKIADVLAARGVAASVWADWWGFKMEAYDGILHNAGLLHAAGGRPVIHSDSDIGIQRLNQEAAKALAEAQAAGLEVDEHDALAWITANAAWVLGIEDQTGVIAPGLRGDLVLWDAPPLTVTARASQVWVAGVEEYRAARDRLEVGGSWSDFFVGQATWPVAPTGEVGPALPAPAVAAVTPTLASPATCLVGGTVLPVDAAPFVGGVCFADGRITWRGTGDPPAGATVVDVTGSVVTPGFFETQTRLGLVEVDAEVSSRDMDAGGTDPVRARYDVRDSLTASSSLFAITRSGGVTSAVTAPRGGLVSGQAAVLDLWGGDARQMLVEPARLLATSLGSRGGAAVGTARGVAVQRLRELFEDARLFRARQADYERGQLRALAAGRLDLAVLAMAAAGNLSVWVSADRADDILQALALAESEGLTIVIVGATEGWRVASALAAAGVPVVVDPLSNLPRSLEAMQPTAWNAALLRAAGVEVVLSSGETHNARNLRYVAGNAVRDGLHPADALRAITWAPAIAAGLGGDRGTLQVGHVANVAVWSADPLAIASRLQRLYVRGHEATTLSRQDALMERYREDAP